MVQKGGSMKSLTLHALDSQLAAQLKRCAEEQSVSMNELAKRILSEGLGIKAPSVASPHRDEFSDFCGVWSEKEAEDFEAKVSDMGKVDSEDWK